MISLINQILNICLRFVCWWPPLWQPRVSLHKSSTYRVINTGLFNICPVKNIVKLLVLWLGIYQTPLEKYLKGPRPQTVKGPFSTNIKPINFSNISNCFFLNSHILRPSLVYKLYKSSSLPESVVLSNCFSLWEEKLRK